MTPTYNVKKCRGHGNEACHRICAVLGGGGDYSRPGAAEYICGSVMYSTVRACGL